MPLPITPTAAKGVACMSLPLAPAAAKWGARMPLSLAPAAATDGAPMPLGMAGVGSTLGVAMVAEVVAMVVGAAHIARSGKPLPRWSARMAFIGFCVSMGRWELGVVHMEHAG
jgi:hypothetical protein